MQVVLQRVLDQHNIGFAHDFELSMLAKLLEGHPPANLCKAFPTPCLPTFRALVHRNCREMTQFEILHGRMSAEVVQYSGEFSLFEECDH